MVEDTVGSVANAQSQVVQRRLGVTTSERYLQRLAERSFLSLWSYPCVFRDQGRQNGGREGKELADLLVVFDQHILIFSDKDCEFGDSGDLELDWSRWYRRAVEKSAQQVWGAERWIKNHPDRLYLDPECSQQFPIPLPDPSVAKIHRIVVAHGASARCRRKLGGTGSLMIAPDVVGPMHTASRADGDKPFMIGHLDLARGFVHVLDDTSLDVLMSTLDTITDFINYLSKKEQFVQSGKLLFAAGEDDLLAWYLKDLNADGEHDFIVPSGANGVGIDEGIWTRFVQSPERQAQIRANEVSYAWDRLIERFGMHILAGTQYYTTQAGIEHGERVMRFLAREPRTRRRLLARTLVSMIETTAENMRRTVVVEPSRPGDPHYVFLLLPRLPVVAEADYREARRQLLIACCMVAKLERPTARDIIGIATDTGRNPYMERSEDAVYYDASIWTPKDEAEARKLQQDLGLLTNVTKHASVVQEYPLGAHQLSDKPIQSPGMWMKGRNRNTPCPCGSGKKLKKCCGA